MRKSVEKAKYFSAQKADEVVLKVMRKHWLVLMPTIVITAIVYLFGIFAIFILPNLLPILVQGFSYNIYVMVVSLTFLFNTVYLFTEILIYYFNVGIITNEHLVEIEQARLFSRTTSELMLDNIQDVTASQSGVFPTMFDYGDINIQTAGKLPNFMFTSIRNPNTCAQEIIDASERYVKKHGAFRGAGIAKDKKTTVL